MVGCGSCSHWTSCASLFDPSSPGLNPTSLTSKSPDAASPSAVASSEPHAVRNARTMQVSSRRFILLILMVHEPRVVVPLVVQRPFERQRRVLVEAFSQVDSWGFMRSWPQPPSPWLPNLDDVAAARGNCCLGLNGVVRHVHRQADLHETSLELSCAHHVVSLMANTAVHLEQRMLPAVPIRHWIGSLPWSLRALLGYDRRLCAQVVGAFAQKLMRSVRQRAKRLLGLESVTAADSGAVAAIQRTDGAMRLRADARHVPSMRWTDTVAPGRPWPHPPSPGSWPNTASVPDLRLPRTAPSPLSSSYRSRAEPPSRLSERGARVISRRRPAVPLHLDRSSPSLGAAENKPSPSSFHRSARRRSAFHFRHQPALLDSRRSSTAFRRFPCPRRRPVSRASCVIRSPTKATWERTHRTSCSDDPCRGTPLPGFSRSPNARRSPPTAGTHPPSEADTRRALRLRVPSRARN